MFLTEVIAIYAKTSGQGSKHADVDSSTNISATSRISVRLLEHMNGGIFQYATPITSPFNTRAYAHILPHEFLVVLKKEVRTHPQGLTITPVDEAVFKSLKKGLQQLTGAMEMFRKRKTTTVDV